MSNILKMLRLVFPQPNRQAAKIMKIRADGLLDAETLFGGHSVVLRGSGYVVGASVFYDAKTGRILENAPDVKVVEIRV
ncbi:hypothetical protein [Simonsiella muelleri]|uniref:hypothetical protein n=1 Tax=Simonsiella muelleri TaxID=72 RepID=UPI0028D06443|nr:hypothetical protein [Simonsiella muelleri]